MKGLKLIIILILFIWLSRSKSYSAIGCMDNSYHGDLSKADYKSYHYVQCDCPCSYIISKRGKCRKCGHFGIPERGVFNLEMRITPDSRLE